MADLIDFDATLAEAEGGPATFPFRFLGEEWELPRSPLAKDMLKVRRMYMRVGELELKKATGELTEADADKMLEVAGGANLDDLLAMMIGRPMVELWFDAGMTDEQLRRVFRYLWKLYNGMDPNESEGEAPAPNRAARRAGAAARTSSKSSSKGSASSQRTGSGSTTKTSRKRSGH